MAPGSIEPILNTCSTAASNWKDDKWKKVKVKAGDIAKVKFLMMLYTYFPN